MAARPFSVYDVIEPSPFGWATPAADRGMIPVPWRVAHADRALVAIKQLAEQAGIDVRDLYVEHHPEFRAFGEPHMALWVGLRDNRDRQAHDARIDQLSKRLAELQLLTERTTTGALILIDDQPRNVLRMLGHEPTPVAADAG